MWREKKNKKKPKKKQNKHVQSIGRSFKEAFNPVEIQFSIFIKTDGKTLFVPNPNLSLLWLMSDDFTRQRETFRARKG